MRIWLGHVTHFQFLLDQLNVALGTTVPPLAVSISGVPVTLSPTEDYPAGNGSVGQIPRFEANERHLYRFNGENEKDIVLDVDQERDIRQFEHVFSKLDRLEQAIFN